MLQRLYAPIQGNARVRMQEWMGWRAGQREGIRDFQDSIWIVNEKNLIKNCLKKMNPERRHSNQWAIHSHTQVFDKNTKLKALIYMLVIWCKPLQAHSWCFNLCVFMCTLLSWFSESSSPGVFIPMALTLCLDSSSSEFPELWEVRFDGEIPFKAVCFEKSLSTWCQSVILWICFCLL